jgi:hypothetical protein
MDLEGIVSKRVSGRTRAWLKIKEPRVSRRITLRHGEHRDLRPQPAKQQASAIRHGYRKIAALLRDAGWLINAKRVERTGGVKGSKFLADSPNAGDYG